MSSKKTPENKPISQPPNSSSFSFLELDNFLSQDNFKKVTQNNPSIKPSTKKNLSKEKKPEKKQALKIKPNVAKAREQTNEDLMYIENEDNIQEDQDKEKIKEKSNKDINNANSINIKEKNIINKKNEQNKEKEKIDKRIVKLNLDKDKIDDKAKNKKKENEKEINDDDNIDNKEKKLENYDIESIINDIKEKDPKAYVPIVLPFAKEEQKKNLKDELNKDDGMFIFQFPRQIPIKDLNTQSKIKEEENTNEEPNYDENGFLISQEFKNSFNEIKDNTVIGKLVIMKSGKIKIKMGDIYFDINEGSLTKFAQYSAVVTGNNDNRAFILGQPFNKKLIVTPEFE